MVKFVCTLKIILQLFALFSTLYYGVLATNKILYLIFRYSRMTSNLTGHSFDDFIKLNKLGEGTYGVVFKVALKCSDLPRFNLFSARTTRRGRLWQSRR